MRILDALREKLGTDERVAEGTIRELKVVDSGDAGVRWLIRLDGQDGVFCFEPSAISRPRRVGDRVRIGYRSDSRQPVLHQASWVMAA